ncbi:ABC transporter substrate-binding protein [Swingsia samuiensis]|uniref:ABC transporter substrate-binding protein n=1 Tax=Swingsia samuiensis TaxID=1293412 RepID=UPI001FE4763E|nr:ABC transporter substrate-binding protein [Swingsia samuiensis]
MKIEHQPRRAVIHDINMAEMAFSLHLQPYIYGLTGISGWNTPSKDFKQQQGRIPEIATRYPTLEQLVASQTDFFFAGWNYGMRIGGDVTPETLAQQGIPSVVLSESCLRAGGKLELPTLDLLYNDEIRLGIIFNREELARKLVENWKGRVENIRIRLRKIYNIKVFLYDSGEDQPFTAGRYALASELMRLSGGVNIFDDLQTNWGVVSWESVAMREPDVILMVDYGKGVEQKLEFLRHNSLMKENAAVKNNKIYIVHYDDMTPSPQNIPAIEKMALFFHPEMMK